MGQGWKTTFGVGWMCFAKDHLWASSPELDSSGVEQRVTTAAAGSTAHFWDQGRAQGLQSQGVWREANKKFEGWKRQGQAELREGGIHSRRIPVLDPSPQECLGTGLSMGRSGNESILSTREWRNCFKPRRKGGQRLWQKWGELASKNCAWAGSWAEMWALHVCRCWLQPGWTLVMWWRIKS